MANTIETIPEKTRWEIATKGLTGAYIAISKALEEAAGQMKFEEFDGSLWHEAGKGAREFADACGVGHQRWGDKAAETLNPNFTFRLAKNMLHGDSHCEWVVERKK